MPVGYEGIAYIQGDIVLCTSASVPEARARLDSSSGYGGSFSLSSSPGIGSPHNYDWAAYEGSLGVEVNEKVFDARIKDWLFDREESREIEYRPRSGSRQIFDECYWTAISLSASEGAVVTGNISFTAVEQNDPPSGDYRNKYDNYITNKQGIITPADLATTGDIPALNPGSDPNSNPVPFWRTSIDATGWTILGTGVVEVLEWTANFNQDLVEFNGCFSEPSSKNVNPIAPFFGLGVMQGSLELSVLVLNDRLGIRDLSRAVINIGDSDLDLRDLELDTTTDDVQTASTVVPVGLAYSVYRLVA